MSWPLPSAFRTPSEALMKNSSLYHHPLLKENILSLFFLLFLHQRRSSSEETTALALNKTKQSKIHLSHFPLQELAVVTLSASDSCRSMTSRMMAASMLNPWQYPTPLFQRAKASSTRFSMAWLSSASSPQNKEQPVRWRSWRVGEGREGELRWGYV